MNAIETIRAEAKRRERLVKKAQKFAAGLAYEIDLGTPGGQALLECARDIEAQLMHVRLTAPHEPVAEETAEAAQ